MNNKFCANVGNINKKFWNSKHENTKVLYNQVIHCESNFLTVKYEFIPADSNENAIDVAKLCIQNKRYESKPTVKREGRLSTSSCHSDDERDYDAYDLDDAPSLHNRPPLVKHKAIEF